MDIEKKKHVQSIKYGSRNKYKLAVIYNVST